MKRIWPIIYSLAAPFMVYSGYSGIRNNRNTNIDWIALTIIPVAFALVPIGLFMYGLHYSGKPSMPRPTLDRHPFGWWTDTLQALRCSSIGLSLCAIGAIMAYPAADDQGRMVIYAIAILATSTATGEILVYRIFGNRIRE